ncbi:MAG: hypothetical protein J0L87_00175 [Bacteroidetes bacterium]|nr:hypothetical protein [Bacteroidota bacterium]
MNATLEFLRIKAEMMTINQHHLINETEAVDLLGNEFPTINNDLEKTANATNIYKAMQCFSDFTKQLINKGNFKEVRHCFKVAENMLENGNSTVKNAIENSYLYSIYTLLDLASPVSQKVKSLLTYSLKKEYNKQVCSSGI